MPFLQNIAGTWKSGAPWMNISGTWTGGVLWSNVAGVWKAISQVFNPVGGNYSDFKINDTAFVTLTSVVPATWTYTKTGSPAGTANVVSGGIASSITFSITPPGFNGTRGSTFTVQGSAAGQIEDYTIVVEAEADNA